MYRSYARGLLEQEADGVGGMELEAKMALEETLEPVCAEIYASIVDGGGLAAPLDAAARALVDAAHGRIRRDVRNAPAFLAILLEALGPDLPDHGRTVLGSNRVPNRSPNESV